MWSRNVAIGVAAIAVAASIQLARRANRRAFPLPAPGGAVLVTGASTGLGKDAAVELAKNGFVVFAGVRKHPDFDTMSKFQGISPVVLDVTDPDSVESAALSIEKELSQRGIPLVGIVNNAGICRMAPMEFDRLEDVRSVFEVNYFGALRVTQRFLPLIRAAKGRIINVSSMSGLSTTHWLGGYSSSKYALEAMNDALRLELEPLDVSVTMINPGIVKTAIQDKVQASKAAVDPKGEEVYDMGELFWKNYEKMVAGADTTAPVSAAILDALRSPYPKTRYIPTKLMGMPLKHLIKLKFFLPDRIYDMMAQSQKTSPF